MAFVWGDPADKRRQRSAQDGHAESLFPHHLLDLPDHPRDGMGVDAASGGRLHGAVIRKADILYPNAGIHMARSGGAPGRNGASDHRARECDFPEFLGMPVFWDMARPASEDGARVLFK